MKISTKNEYGALKSVIVGRPDNANWPTGDAVFDAFLDLSTYERRLTKGRIPDKVVNEAREDLLDFINLLKDNGVAVHRPFITDWTKTFVTNQNITSGMHTYSARDLLLTVGNTVIECPTPFVSRQQEFDAYYDIRNEAIKDGCRWIAAPRATMRRTDFQILAGKVVLNEKYPVFDAANVMKFNDKLLYLLSGTANRTGAEWLQKVVGTEFEVIVWDGVYSFAHIDSTIASLNKDTVMLNAERVTEDNLPAFLKSHKKIWVKDCQERSFHQFPYASKWIGMNVLSINPETVVVDGIQTELIKQLENEGFKVLRSSLRQSRTLGGGHHCVTCDLERE
jgi:N-dimethylarginine dimethylaminohydrolase